MGITAAISAGLQVVAGWLGLQNKKQDRLNSADVIANKDAARDLKEKERIQGEVEKSDKAGKISDDERKQFSED